MIDEAKIRKLRKSILQDFLTPRAILNRLEAILADAAAAPEGLPLVEMECRIETNSVGDIFIERLGTQGEAENLCGQIILDAKYSTDDISKLLPHVGKETMRLEIYAGGKR